MNCSQALELILEADVTELEGGGDSALSAHVRDCSPCGKLVQQILSEQRELNGLLRAEQPKTSVDTALARVDERVVASKRRRRAWRTAIPVAAAAGVAGILLSDGDRNGGLDSVWQAPEPSSAVGFEIETPPGKNVAVFKVEDRHDIVVVWFYDQGD
ncbi:MAG: hypothetical protein JSW51_03380 [Gemmatimonadota bacterium]|nr:MAG: hypothetical protein JSW51_03380 [Gemmatimonadota bacterium]